MTLTSDDDVKSYRELRPPTGSVVFSFGVSIICHIVLIGGLIFMPAPTHSGKFSSGVVQVSLVTIPSPGKPSGADAQVVAAPKAEVKPAIPEIPVVQAPPQETAPVLPEPKETVSLAPKKKFKDKISLKKKTINRAKMKQSALRQVKNNVEKSETDALAKRIEGLKKKVAETEAADPQKYQFAGKNSGLPGSGPVGGGTGNEGLPAPQIMQVYNAEIAYQIQKNWAFSQQMAGDSADLEAILAIKILPSGEIEDIWFDEHSGNSYLDDSAYKAILKSNPLPPLPREYMEPYYKIGLRFGPKGLQ